MALHAVEWRRIPCNPLHALYTLLRLLQAPFCPVLQVQESARAPEQHAAKRVKLDDKSIAKQAAPITIPAAKQQQRQKPRKQKPMTPELRLTLDVQAAAKSKQASIGLAAYNKAISEGTRINPDLYSTLLYLCAGCDDWELSLRQQLVETTPLVEEIMQMAHASATPEDTGLPETLQEADDAVLTARQNGSGPPSSNCNGADSETATAEPNKEIAVATAEECSASLASTAPAADATATVPAQPGSPSSAPEDGIAVASTSEISASEMTAAQLHAAGRSIFAHMQVVTQALLTFKVLEKQYLGN